MRLTLPALEFIILSIAILIPSPCRRVCRSAYLILGAIICGLTNPYCAPVWGREGPQIVVGNINCQSSWFASSFGVRATWVTHSGWRLDGVSASSVIPGLMVLTRKVRLNYLLLGKGVVDLSAFTIERLSITNSSCRFDIILAHSAIAEPKPLTRQGFPECIWMSSSVVGLVQIFFSFPVLRSESVV